MNDDFLTNPQNLEEPPPPDLVVEPKPAYEEDRDEPEVEPVKEPSPEERKPIPEDHLGEAEEHWGLPDTLEEKRGEWVPFPYDCYESELLGDD
jgi:hypothetical protein